VGPEFRVSESESETALGTLDQARGDRADHRKRCYHVRQERVGDQQCLADGPKEQRRSHPFPKIDGDTTGRRRQDDRSANGRARLRAGDANVAVFDHGLDVVDPAQHDLVVEDSRHQDEHVPDSLVHEKGGKVPAVIDCGCYVCQRASRDPAEGEEVGGEIDGHRLVVILRQLGRQRERWRRTQPTQPHVQVVQPAAEDEPDDYSDEADEVLPLEGAARVDAENDVTHPVRHDQLLAEC